MDITDEDLTEKHWGEGGRLYDAGRIEEAAAEWRALLETTPPDADLHYNLGFALSKLGRDEEAVAQWREAIRLRPDFFLPHYALVTPLVRQIRAGEGKPHSHKTHSCKDQALWHEARILCRQTLALDPPDPGQRAFLLRLLGLAEWKLGEKRAGLAAMKAGVALAAPDDQWGYRHLGFMQTRMGMWRDALGTITALVNLPGYQDSPRAEQDYRLGLIGVGVAVAGGVLVTWGMTRRR